MEYITHPQFLQYLELLPLREKEVSHFIAVRSDEIVETQVKRLIDKCVKVRGHSAGIVVDALPLPGQFPSRPRDFDSGSLAWAARGADLIAVASAAPLESDRPRIAECRQRHALSRRIVLAFVAPPTLGAWVDWARLQQAEVFVVDGPSHAEAA